MTLNEYEILKAQGQKAEAIVAGVLRGGFVLKGVFYAHAGKARGVIFTSTKSVEALRLL